jgi:hypothetical protein
MCMFSGPVGAVSNTKIFARRHGKADQYLVYQMALQFSDDVAMILPLPTPKDATENEVTFINLEMYPKFFRDMQEGFPLSKPRSHKGDPLPSGSAAEKPKLEVVDVGAFDASFVPRLKDFSRLDERFRLPDSTWEQLPAYKEYGFAVFKLKKDKLVAHPMAFSFPTALKTEVFFPTVHVHDGRVHVKADFDHDLFMQCSADEAIVNKAWEESTQPASMFMDHKKAGRLLRAGAHVYRCELFGKFKNVDVLV